MPTSDYVDRRSGALWGFLSKTQFQRELHKPSQAYIVLGWHREFGITIQNAAASILLGIIGYYGKVPGREHTDIVGAIGE